MKHDLIETKDKRMKRNFFIFFRKIQSICMQRLEAFPHYKLYIYMQMDFWLLSSISGKLNARFHLPLPPLSCELLPEYPIGFYGFA